MGLYFAETEALLNNIFVEFIVMLSLVWGGGSVMDKFTLASMSCRRFSWWAFRCSNPTHWTFNVSHGATACAGIPVILYYC